MPRPLTAISTSAATPSATPLPARCRSFVARALGALARLPRISLRSKPCSLARLVIALLSLALLLRPTTPSTPTSSPLSSPLARHGLAFHLRMWPVLSVSWTCLLPCSLLLRSRPLLSRVGGRVAPWQRLQSQLLYVCQALVARLLLLPLKSIARNAQLR